MLNKLQTMRKNMKKKSKGFTLVELIVVIVIIAILAAVAIPRIVAFQDNARKSRINSEHRQLVTAVQSYLAQSSDPAAQAAKLTSIETLKPFMNNQQGKNLADELAKDAGVGATTAGNGAQTTPGGQGNASTAPTKSAHTITGGVLKSTFTPTNGSGVEAATWTYNFQ